MRGVIRAGHKNLKSDQDPDSVETENKWELVHMTGKSYTETEVHDGQLDYTRGNIYRMACTAEMYQRVERREHRRKRVKRGGKMRTETEVVYVYENKWVSHPVDSSQFRRKSEQDKNPTFDWPMRNHVVKANDVKVGGYYLAPHQCDRLGSTDVRENWDGDHGEA